MITAIVVDDVATVRKALRRLLSKDGEIAVVAEGRDGNDAVALTEAHHPDIVLMDVDMPRMDGLEATRRIMERCATPILIITSSSVYDQRHMPFSAIEAGALDVFPKPNIRSNEDWDSAAAKLRHAVHTLSRVRVITRTSKLHVSRILRARRLRTAPGWIPSVAVIGASTGGPAVIRQILEELPGDYPIPIAVVQHIGEDFVPSFAEWLDHHTAIRVSLAEDGQALMAGGAVVAPGGVHLRLAEGPSVRLECGPEVHHCRPSVDVLFHSAAQMFRSDVVGVLLTGMDRDGVDGMRSIHLAGGVTVAQEQESCAVYGMPGAAVEAGVVHYVKTPRAIGNWLAGIPKGVAEAG